MKLHHGAAASIGRTALRHSADLGADTSGAVAIEYALLIAMIAMAVVGTIGQLGAALVGLPLPSLIDALS
jgi:Flp pilus assembly pilin Flp